MGEASQSNSICFSGFATAINQIKFGEKNSGFQNFPSKDSWFHGSTRTLFRACLTWQAVPLLTTLLEVDF